MNYMEVLVASGSYHGSEALTYSSKTLVNIGSIVLVTIRSKRVSGIVVGHSAKPKFNVKPIVRVQVARSLPSQSLALIDWLRLYYPAALGAITSLFVPSNLSVQNQITQPESLPASNPKPIDPPKLNADQTRTLNDFKNSGKSTLLIHGDTGSGKTRVYLELTNNTLATGRSVIVLTPEIGLTSQLADTIKKHLLVPVLVIHSNLTAKQRRELWLQALFSSEPLVIVGPRSALFAPVSNLGLIIVDEAHDNAYKQDQQPRYSALRVAGKLASLHQANLVLGTATPLVSEYYYLTQKQLPISRLTSLAAGQAKPPVIDVINIRQRDQFGRNTYLSDKLLDKVKVALDQNEQALVFLNRRGTARQVICQNCDWQALCPNCNIPLTYHGDNHTMRCHTCGYKTNAVSSCPVCHSPDIVFMSIGTKAVASALSRLFPGAKVARFDTDNTGDERFEKQYQSIVHGEIDILVGTQLLVKGLDLPRLNMVGVVAADSSLYFPDYTAEEQTYQLLTQVIGRVGRGHSDQAGHIVIQTYDPKSRPLQAAIAKDWPSFYSAQLDERRLHHFPPFFYTLKLYCSRRTAASASQSASKLVSQLRERRLPIEIAGPTPRFHEQSTSGFSWQIIVRAKDRRILVEIVNNLPANWQFDLDPLNLL